MFKNPEVSAEGSTSSKGGDRGCEQNETNLPLGLSNQPTPKMGGTNLFDDEPRTQNVLADDT